MGEDAILSVEFGRFLESLLVFQDFKILVSQQDFKIKVESEECSMAQEAKKNGHFEVSQLLKACQFQS